MENQPTLPDKDTPSLPPTPRSLVVESNPRLNPNPNPTTFVQADTSSFKHVVQMLTGSPETAAAASKNPIPPKAAAAAPGPKKPAFKLYERRSSLRNLNLNLISPLVPSFHNPGSSSPSPRRQPEILSPSVLDFPSLVLSPVTPLIHDPFSRSAAQVLAEEKAIAEKGFYLHPSPRSGHHHQDGEMPRLLPLFPVTSPRVSSSSSGSNSSP